MIGSTLPLLPNGLRQAPDGGPPLREDEAVPMPVDISFGDFLASREGRLGVNLGMYVGHSAIRRWVMGEAAHERAASEREIAAMATLVDDAMRAGALGFSSSHAPTHLDLADRPVPSRLATRDELCALADAVGRSGRGSIAYAPESAVEGISADDRARLFERFFVGRTAGATTGGGAGIGLPTALAIAQAHGGTIEVDSEIGRGSTFHLEIPAGPVSDGGTR